MVYADNIEDKIDMIVDALEKRYPELTPKRWYAIKFLERDRSVMEQYPLDLDALLDRSYEKDIINQKYDFIEEIIAEVLINKAQKAERTDRVDAILTNQFLGLPIFLGIMASRKC